MRNSIPKNFSTGISGFFQNLAGGHDQDAYDNEYDKLLKRDLTRAQMANYQSQIGERQIRQNSLDAIPGILSGLNDLQSSQLGDYMAAGKWERPEQMMGPPRTGEQMPWTMNNSAPDWATPEVMQKYQDANQLKAMIGAATSSNPVQNMQALGLGDMMSGRLDPSAAAQMFGAAQGKPSYSQGTQGILNQYTGGVQGTPKTQAEVAAIQALEGQRNAAAAKSAADAEMIGTGKPGATQSLIQFYMGQGMPFAQALSTVNEAKWNPKSVVLDLAPKILDLDRSVRTMDEAKMKAISMVNEIQKEFQVAPQQGYNVGTGAVPATPMGSSHTPGPMPGMQVPATPAGQAGIVPELGAMQQAVTPQELPPPAALGRLKDGVMTQFANGQVWTLESGQPKRVH